MKVTRQLFFGCFRLDTANESLWRGEQAIRLPPKVFAVLSHLLQHAGQLVTKEELLDVVWPDRFVCDASIKVCIREIRRVLNDRARGPRYIETVHRRGYRFVAGVTEAKVLESRENATDICPVAAEASPPSPEGEQESEQANGQLRVTVELWEGGERIVQTVLARRWDSAERPLGVRVVVDRKRA